MMVWECGAFTDAAGIYSESELLDRETSLSYQLLLISCYWAELTLFTHSTTRLFRIYLLPVHIVTQSHLLIEFMSHVGPYFAFDNSFKVHMNNVKQLGLSND